MSAIQTRQNILHAALTMVIDQGLHGTATSAIARKAGVATGTLFHHFPTKDALLTALDQSIEYNYLEALTFGLDHEDSVEDQLRTILINGLRWAQDHPRQHRFRKLLAASPNTAHGIQNSWNQERTLLMVLVEKGRHEGYLKELPTDLLLDVTRGITEALVSHVAEHPELADDPAFLRQAFSVIWNAICAT